MMRDMIIILLCVFCAGIVCSAGWLATAKIDKDRSMMYVAALITNIFAIICGVIIKALSVL